MKRIFTLLAAVLLTATLWAQSPEKMSYQAVIRNSSDQLVTDTQIGMQISILQGSTSGTAVYVETQNPTTNANGLVSIEIGTGTVESGDFTAIDWANGPYFIKTETDPTGGTNYTITGTSQLLSVPYALHAKTAESIVGGITETDPAFVASPANGITSTDITNWNNKLETEVDSSVTNEIQTISRTGTIVTLSKGGGTYTDSVNVYQGGTGIKITGNVISSDYPQPLAIGDFYGGGVIFWLDASNNHGLIASIADQSTGIQWSNEPMNVIGAYYNNIFAGARNTDLIVSKQGAGSYAAQLCKDYEISILGQYYDDWYLPSSDELYRLFENRTVINATAAANGGSVFPDSSCYWCSCEFDNISAIALNFVAGFIFSNKLNTYRVRAIRKF